MLRGLAVLLLMAMPSIVSAQLTLEDEVNNWEANVAGCDCIIPEKGEAQFLWSAHPDVNFLPMGGTGERIAVWSKPGEDKWIRCVVIITEFQELEVLVPGSNFPTDPTDFNKQTIKLLIGTSTQEFSKTFTVIGGTPTPPGPEPGPDPNPDPDPDPDPAPAPDGFAGEIHEWFVDMGNTFDKETAEIIADNYSSIASQGSDPARSSGWDLGTFTNRTRALNAQNLDTDVLGEWADPFFRKLATRQYEIFQERDLSNDDVRGVATLWDETAKAIREAASKF